MEETIIRIFRGYTENVDLTQVLDHVYSVTGFRAHKYRLSTLQRRLQLRMSATQTENYREYLDFLHKNSSECHKFLDTLTINVSDFFRDQRVFSSLEKRILPGFLPSLSARKRIRAWSIGCSRGQEPYSLAIVLSEVFRKEACSLEFLVTATDVDKKVLCYAKRAIYTKKEIKTIPRRYLNAYVEKIGPDEFKISENIRKKVKFKHHDFITGEGLGKFDLIFCRNLFIFLEPLLQEEMLRKIHSSLKKGGILVFGTAEMPREKHLFQCLSSHDHIYQKVI